MRNSEIAAALDELATLYELDGAIRYRVIAYREAARTVRNTPQSLKQLADEGRLTELHGVGDTLAEKITTLLETGEIPAAAKLRQKFPPSLIQVTRVKGLGAKTARRLYDELGIQTLEQLRDAAQSEQIRNLKGLGARVEENVLAALEAMEDGDLADRRLLSEALPIGEDLVGYLADHPAARRVAMAGSIRRWSDSCKDIDLVAAASDPAGLARAMAEHPLVAQARRSGEAGASVVTHHGISIELRIGKERSFGNLLQHLTGSAEHNVELRERALSKGYSVSEHGVARTKGKKVHRFADESAVYELLDLPYIEPELREGNGEIAAAEKGKLPQLVSVDDIRGELHSHTTLSDGKATMEEMAEAARARGYRYLAVTDHSATHGFGNDVTARQLAVRIEEVRKFNSEVRGFRLLAGSEVNVMPDGSLDYPDDLLAELDWMIASVHTSFRISEKHMTERVIAAIEHPLVDCIGHLTGRLLLRREPYPIDVERVAEAAAANGTMLEINANPRRRDLSDRHARLAAEAGVKIAVNTDAHSIREFDNIRYGVATARRGWLSADQVANTRNWQQLKPLLSRSRA